MLIRSHPYNTGPSVELSEDYRESRLIVGSKLAQAGTMPACLLNAA
jgi:hypothetical protein